MAIALSQRSSIEVILVAEGQEYQAVCRGVQRSRGFRGEVLPMPMGYARSVSWLRSSCESAGLPVSEAGRVLVLGLCGSLRPEYGVTQIGVYRGCYFAGTGAWRQCDRLFSEWLSGKLGGKGLWVKGYTSEGFVASGAEKRRLGEVYGAEVIDMEGFGLLEVLGAAVGMVRVVSDDCLGDLPDLNRAIADSLRPWPLAQAMLAKPRAAARLIVGSLRALRVLEQVTVALLDGD